jgi:chaperone modulatory protein CbpM
MIETTEFLIRTRLEQRALEMWIEAGWLRPRAEAGTRKFSEIDIARAQLIHDLQEDMRVNDEGISVVLDLVDQMYGLRCSLQKVFAAVCDLPDDVRLQIYQSVASHKPPPES